MPERTLLGPYRPRIEPTEEDVAKIEALAGDGFAVIEIARAVGVSKDTLSRWRTDHASVSEALEVGKAKEHTALRSKLMEKAMAGDTVAILFMLKCRHGYREGASDDAGNRVSITFDLPGAKPLDKFMTVENESNPRIE